MRQTASTRRSSRSARSAPSAPSGRRSGWTAPAKDERGVGLVSTLSGVAIFMAFLLLGAHVLVHLYATSVLTANAFDAARIVSGSSSGEDRVGAAARAQAQALAQMGGFADRVAFTWEQLGPDEIVLTAAADTPNLLPALLARGLGMDMVERTVRLRVEAFES